MSTLNDDESPSDWEIKDEEPPEQLRKKWEHEEAAGSKTVVCSSCKKETSAENLTCIYCRATIFRESCSFHCFLNWVQRLLKKG